MPLRVGVLLIKTNDSDVDICGVEKDLNMQIHRGMHLDILQEFETQQPSLTQLQGHQNV